MKRYLSLPALGLAAALTLSACGADSGSDTSTGAESSSSAPTDTSSSGEAPVAEEHNDADVMFAQLMIPHHRQAVEMSDMMLSKDGISPEVTDLATRIRDAQGPEVDTMADWLEAWGEPIEPEGGMEGHDMGSMDSGAMEVMDGMMSEDQMSELDAAEGMEATRLFLESMIVHHEGALDMAQDQIDDGQNTDAIVLAESIVATQQSEIDEMKELLAAL